MGDSVVDEIVDVEWKGFSVTKRELVFQAMIIGYECLSKKETPRLYIEKKMKEVKDGPKEQSVDLGQLGGFLDKERGVVALSILISLFGSVYVSEHINSIFGTLRILAEDGLRIIKREVLDKNLSIVKNQIESVMELPTRIKTNELDC